eukprot:g25450.t1
MRGQNSRKQATVSFEDLQRGYAAHFAFWFNGDLDYHFGNVRAVSDAYAVNASDVLQACEVPFQREHGRSLLAAFQTEEIRKVEVCRAKQILLQHAASVPVKGQRQLALEGGSLPKRAKALANEAEPRKRTTESQLVALPSKRIRNS